MKDAEFRMLAVRGIRRNGEEVFVPRTLDRLSKSKLCVVGQPGACVCPGMALPCDRELTRKKVAHALQSAVCDGDRDAVFTLGDGNHERGARFRAGAAPGKIRKAAPDDVARRRRRPKGHHLRTGFVS